MVGRRAGVAAVAAWLAAGAALAQPQPSQGGDPEALVREGIALRDRGDYEAARRAFQRAYEAGRSTRALAQMGLMEQALGRWVEADEHVRAALARDDEWARRNRAALDQALATIAQHVARLVVTSDAPGATVWVGARQVAALPLREPLRLVAEEVTFEVRAPGRVTARRTRTLRAGEEAREHVELAPESAAGAAVATGAAAGGRAPGAGRTAGTTRGPGAGPWVLIGVGAAGLAASAVFFALRGSAVSDLGPRCPGGACDEDDATARDLYDRAVAYDAASAVSLGVGAAAVAGGVLWLVVGGRRAAPPADVGVRATTGGVVLSVGGAL